MPPGYGVSAVARSCTTLPTVTATSVTASLHHEAPRIPAPHVLPIIIGSTLLLFLAPLSAAGHGVKLLRLPSQEPSSARDRRGPTALRNLLGRRRSAMRKPTR